MKLNNVHESQALALLMNDPSCTDAWADAILSPRTTWDTLPPAARKKAEQLYERQYGATLTHQSMFGAS